LSGITKRLLEHPLLPEMVYLLEMLLLPVNDPSTFYKLLKTYLYHSGWTGIALE